MLKPQTTLTKHVTLVTILAIIFQSLTTLPCIATILPANSSRVFETSMYHPDSSSLPQTNLRRNVPAAAAEDDLTVRSRSQRWHQRRESNVMSNRGVREIKSDSILPNHDSLFSHPVKQLSAATEFSVLNNRTKRHQTSSIAGKASEQDYFSSDIEQVSAVKTPKSMAMSESTGTTAFRRMFGLTFLEKWTATKREFKRAKGQNEAAATSESTKQLEAESTRTPQSKERVEIQSSGAPGISESTKRSESESALVSESTNRLPVESTEISNSTKRLEVGSPGKSESTKRLKVESTGTLESTKQLESESTLISESTNRLEVESTWTSEPTKRFNTESNGVSESKTEPGSEDTSRFTRTREEETQNAIPSEQNEVHVQIPSEDVADCYTRMSGKTFSQSSAETWAYREIRSMNGSIAVESSTADLLNTSQDLNTSFYCEGTFKTIVFPTRGYCCNLRVRVPAGMYAGVNLIENKCSVTVLYDSARMLPARYFDNIEQSEKPDHLVFVGSSNRVNIFFFMAELDGSCRFTAQFRGLVGRGLSTRQIDANRGMMETPFFGERQTRIPWLEPWAHVDVPADHMIMVSFPDVHEIMTCVALYAGDRANETLAKFCREEFKYLRASIHSTSLLIFHLYFSYGYRPEHFGFRIFFSFHNESAVPEKLPDHSWNCSVPYKRDFLYHLKCNMETECRHAEDETGCWYDRCGPGYMTLGGACFFFMRKDKKRITWFEASAVCSLRGGRLAVLNTEDKWFEATTILSVASKIFLGIRTVPTNSPLWYRSLFRWTDGTSAFYVHIAGQDSMECGIMRCGVMSTVRYIRKTVIYVRNHCNDEVFSDILCEKTDAQEVHPSIIPINGTDNWSAETAHVKCPLGHYTHRFLVCDVKSSCMAPDHYSPCDWSSVPLPPSFTCSNRVERVPYTLVCDYRSDCFDGSDENFCAFAACQTQQFQCDNSQCIPLTKICDGWGDCYKNEDESICRTPTRHQKVISPPALVRYSSDGHLILDSLGAASAAATGERAETCLNTHFQCLDDGYCLPVSLRCNGVSDCPGREDEVGCDACPGYYRCRASTVCLPSGELCDGHAHCPQHDDELMCGLTCPPSCVCFGMSFFCRHSFAVSEYPFLRFLDASSSAVSPTQLTANLFLIYLALANCGLTHIDGLSLPNLLILNIQENQLKTIRSEHLVNLPQLRDLSLAGNPLADMFVGTGKSRSFPHMTKLDLSRVVLRNLDVTTLAAFPNLRVLEHLREIDLRGCSMTWFPREMFQSLKDLQTVHAHSFKMCCSAVLPAHFNARNCFAPWDEISSCDDLLRGTEYSVFVFISSLLAVFGNAVCFIFRSFVSKHKSKLGYGSLVSHLSVSDFLMGVYLVIIGVADQVYHGTYVWNEGVWKHSGACRFAGFLSLLSSEVSALIMCLITIDRYLVLRYPFSRFHFTPTSAHVASTFVWICGAFLASVPLLPMTKHWNFYSQTGICIPLPITRKDFAGHSYSFGIVIIFNFVVFVFISMGQLSIYLTIRANSMSVSNNTKKTKGLTIASRLFTVAITDFLCWFPIGVLGLLASNDFPISSEVSVAVAIFVLPLNSAVNPYLYTINVIQERRKRILREKLRNTLMLQLKRENQGAI